MTWRSRPASKVVPSRAAVRRAARWSSVASLLWAAVCFPAGEVRDQLGIAQPGAPVHRIVALAPDVVELVFALGAGARVVAVPRAADFPPAARTLPHVGPADIEDILAARPDLVVATTAGNDPLVIARLRDLGMRVFVADVTSCDRLADACQRLGSLLTGSPGPVPLATRIASRCTAARVRGARLPPRRALYVVWWDPLIVAGPGTFHDDMLRIAGLENLAPGGAGRYPRIDPEVLLDPRLEVVVAPDEPDVRAGYDRVAAGVAGRRLTAGAVTVIWLPADPASRPGPRLVDAIDALLAAREARP
ncbi:MAG: ABC transporter substrate-binding protein [Acidobacteriota bacterium]